MESLDKMNRTIQLHDLHFTPFILEADILGKVEEMARKLSQKYADKNPLFLGVLNGAYIFAADLVRACEFNCEISFIKLSSYSGTKSTENLATLIGLAEPVEDRHVIIVEDIIDSGQTLNKFIPELLTLGPKSVEVAALLVKPEAMEYKVDIHYKGFEIPPAFVVGYGLDYDGLGRNLRDIYQLKILGTD